MRKVKITNNTMINGKPAAAGDVYTLNPHDANTLIGANKAIEVNDSGDEVHPAENIEVVRTADGDLVQRDPAFDVRDPEVKKNAGPTGIAHPSLGDTGKHPVAKYGDNVDVETIDTTDGKDVEPKKVADAPAQKASTPTPTVATKTTTKAAPKSKA